MLSLLLVLSLSQMGTAPADAVSGMPLRNQTGTAWADMELFPPGGRGMPVAQELCDAAPTMTGTWLCYRGSDATTTGTLGSFAATGAGTTQRTSLLLPSGPSGASTTWTAYEGIGSYSSLTTDWPVPGAGIVVTWCHLGAIDKFEQADNAGWGKSSAAPASYTAFAFGIDMTSTTFDPFARNGSGTVFATCTAGYLGAEHLVCGEYSEVTGVIKGWKDGTPCSSPGASASKNLIATAGGKLSVGNLMSAGSYEPTSDRTRGYLAFEGSWSDAQHAALARAVLADAPTDVHNYPLVYSRTGPKGCIQPSTNTGSIVPTNRPCLHSGGLLAEQTGTNALTAYDDASAAAWVKEQDAAPRTPTVTANYAVSPIGTMTADRAQLPATSGAQYSDFYQSFSVAAAAATTCQVMVKGTSADGTTDLCGYNGSAWTCTTCNFLTASYGPCTHIMAAGVGTSRYCKLGNNSSQNGGTARSAVDILVWGLDAKAEDFASSIVPTTTVAVARGADNATMTLPTAIGPNFGMAATVAFTHANVGTTNLFFLGTAGAGTNAGLYRNSDTTAGYEIGATVTTPAVASMSTTWHRSALADVSGTRTAYWDAAAVAAPAASLSAGQTAINIGQGPSGTVQANGVVKHICLRAGGLGGKCVQ